MAKAPVKAPVHEQDATGSKAQPPAKKPAPLKAKAASEPEVNKTAAPLETKRLPPVGKFVFAIRKGIEIPADYKARHASSLELPFKHWFGSMVHNDEVFLPDSFWTAPRAEGGREVPEEKLTSTYVRSKVRDAFRKWQASDDTRINRSLVMIERKPGDCNGEYPDGGFSIFMQIAQ